LGICKVDTGGNVLFRIGAHQYKVESFNGDVLFFNFDNSVSFSYATQDMVLNDEIYARVRDAIANKIVNQILSRVADIQV